MIVKPAEINKDGLIKVMELSANPAILDTEMGNLCIGFAGQDQIFIPGISIPGTETPFHVPVIGDNESISLLIDRPTKLEAPYIERVTFVGMLIAESVRVELPKEEYSAFILDEDTAEFKLDETYDHYTGEWGGFLSLVVKLKYVDLTKSDSKELIGSAELYLIESEEEFIRIHEVLEKGKFGAYDLVNLAKMVLEK